MLSWIILFSLLGGVFSMVGGVLLLWQVGFSKRIAFVLISFAAGVLLAVSFLDLLPEALHELPEREVGVMVLVAIAAFFTLERLLWWYHHHRYAIDDTHAHEHPVHQTHAYMLLVGDGIHNFVDGILIAAAFLADFQLGLAVSAGIILHEVPQEIADFGVMINAGFQRARVIALNLIAATATLVGALVAYAMLGALENVVPYILAAGAGVFVYVALSDLLPAVHHHQKHRFDILHVTALVLGIVLIFSLGAFGLDGHGAEDEHEDEHEEEENEMLSTKFEYRPSTVAQVALSSSNGRNSCLRQAGETISKYKCSNDQNVLSFEFRYLNLFRG